MGFRMIDIAIAAAAAFLFFFAAQAPAGEDAVKLANARGCSACHAPDKKLIGPAYKDVAKKYRDNREAAALLEKKVLDGGSGVWGAIPMPPHKGKLTDAEVRLLVGWVLRH